ncbi:MAG TPA: hypothetical protein VNI20_10220 [Fimbriimonadaceae bacterium]|nr:hypothetical protein [Fimbriimonadaceae bacterium]
MDTTQKTSDYAVVSDNTEDVAVRTTSGYVPIVGTDPGGDGTTLTAPADSTSTTDASVTLVDGSTMLPAAAANAAANGKKVKAKGFSITITGVVQQYDNSGAWTDIPSTDPSPPFSTDVEVSTNAISLNSDEQFGISVTNQSGYNTNYVRIQISYSISKDSQTFARTITINRSPFTI